LRTPNILNRVLIPVTSSFTKSFTSIKVILTFCIELIEATVTNKRAQALKEVKDPFVTKVSDVQRRIQNAIQEASNTRYSIINLN
jgi:hypothetical protein